MLQDRYCVKVYNQRYVKVSVCHSDRDGMPAFSGNTRHNERKQLEEEEVIENLKRSARRAYQAIMARAYGMGVDRMLTLTFAKNVTASSKEVAMLCFQRFVRLCRKAFGAFDYVATTELQKRGAIHFHMGVTQYYDVWQLWALWRKAIIESGLAESSDKVGSVFINKKWKQTKKGVVAYIAKYIIKESYRFIQNNNGLRDKFGKRYFSSQVKLEKLVFIAPKGDTMMIFNLLISDFKEKTGKHIILRRFERVECFILGLSWSFSDGFLV